MTQCQTHIIWERSTALSQPEQTKRIEKIQGEGLNSIHLDYLDGLRAVAALFVVLNHGLSYTGLNTMPMAFWLRWPLSAFTYGTYAVDLFIVLSGFCLMLPVARGGNWKYQYVSEFYWRRAQRILPTYYCAILFSLILIYFSIHEKTGSIWDLSIPITVKSIVSHLILSQDAFGESHTINYVLWSIGVEWRIYFLFPLLVLSWRQLGAETTVAIALAASFALYVFCFIFIHVTLSAHYIGLFALGMLGASISFNSDHAWAKNLNWTWISIGAAALVVLASTWRIYRGLPIPSFMADYLVGGFSMAALVMASTNAQHPVHIALSWKPLATLGSFAYSIYLIHAPLLQVVWQAAPIKRLTPWVASAGLVVVIIPAIVACSYVFFLVCERPFLRKTVRIPHPETC